MAAGASKRLGASHEGPKILLDMGGRSLLLRRLDSLAAVGVHEVFITVGFEAERIRAAVAASPYAGRVRLVTNPRYREGSILSLQVQADVLRSGRTVLVMDGDVLHDTRMVARLLDTPGDAVLLVDPVLDPGEEPVKACFRDDVLVDLRKVPEEPHDRHGESVGFFRFSPAMADALADRCDAEAADHPDKEYEEAIRDLILANGESFQAADIGDLPWTEIDFESDILRARAEVLPLLEPIFEPVLEPAL